MRNVWVIQATMAIEFKNGNFDKWDERPTKFYGFEHYEDSVKELQKLRQEEVKTYRKWLKEKDNKKCFIHHCWQIDSLMIFSNFNDF